MHEIFGKVLKKLGLLIRKKNYLQTRFKFTTFLHCNSYENESLYFGNIVHPQTSNKIEFSFRIKNLTENIYLDIEN